jgi:hypothetical protein
VRAAGDGSDECERSEQDSCEKQVGECSSHGSKFATIQIQPTVAELTRKTKIPP